VALLVERKAPHTQDSLQALRDLKEEALKSSAESSLLSANFSEKTAPLNSERLPKGSVPRNIYIKNSTHDTCPVPYEDFFPSGAPHIAKAAREVRKLLGNFQATFQRRRRL